MRRRGRFLVAFPFCLLSVAGIGVGKAGAQSDADFSIQRLAAELLPRAEALSGLEAKRPLNVAARSRADFVAFLQGQLEEEETKTALRNADLVYGLLGLIPDGTNLDDLSVTLMAEQIGGYYDPRRDSLYVITDIPSDRLRSVLVHEIVHALQAQHAPLDSLLSPALGGDRGIAARAAIEGHATIVEAIFTMEEMGSRPASAADLPDMTMVPLEFIFGSDPQPVLTAAPTIVRESMVFPYIRGAGFVQALWRRSPGVAPLHDLMPTSTEQLIDPERRFFGQLDPPVEIIFTDEPSSEWTTEYENTFGQFELSILLRERHVLYGSERYALGWAGDRYRVLTDGERHVLLWYLVWDDSRSAFNFATAYRQLLHMRLNRSAWVEEATVDGRSVVRIVEAREPIDYDSLPRPELRFADRRR